MNLAQKIAVAVTLLLVAALFLFQGSQAVVKRWDDQRAVFPYEVVMWRTTCFDVAGIALIGGAVTLLLGIKRKRAKDEQKPAA